MLATLLRVLRAFLVVGASTVVVAFAARPIGAEPPWAIVGARLVGLMLVAAGGALWAVDRRHAALAASMAGLSWAGLTWSIERANGADAVVGSGMLLAPLLVPMLVLMVIGLPELWRMPGRLVPVLIAASVMVATAGVLRALVYEPIRDLRCGLFCGHSPVAVVADLELAMRLGLLAAGLSALTCGAVAIAILSVPSRTAAARRYLATQLLGAFAMGALSLTSLAGILEVASAVPSADPVLLVAIRAAACLALAGAACILAADRWSTGRRLARIAELLAGDGERRSAEGMLREAVGDPALSIGYWTEERGYVGSDGEPVDVSASGRQRLELTNRDRPVAMILHATGVLSPELVEAHLGPDARLAIQNESLELELRRRVEQLQASRRRVVDAGDTVRRQLERDLHDGAQQLLLALAFEIRRGERHAKENGDEPSAALFGEARFVAGRMLDQLRLLAQGIHPAVLTNVGLDAALTSYAGSLDAAPSLSVDVPNRLAPAVEAAVYAMTTSLLASAPPGRKVSCSIEANGDRVRILVDRDLPVSDPVLDRLGAAGGWCEQGPGGPELVLPCA